METHVSRKQEPKWNIEELADAEIYSAIRYLDEELPEDSHSDNPLSRERRLRFLRFVF